MDHDERYTSSLIVETETPVSISMQTVVLFNIGVTVNGAPVRSQDSERSLSMELLFGRKTVKVPGHPGRLMNQPE